MKQYPYDYVELPDFKSLGTCSTLFYGILKSIKIPDTPTRALVEGKIDLSKNRTVLFGDFFIFLTPIAKYRKMKNLDLLKNPPKKKTYEAALV